MFDHNGGYTTAMVYVGKDYAKYFSNKNKKGRSDTFLARSDTNVTVEEKRITPRLFRKALRETSLQSDSLS